ncbi:MAG: DUF4276 family protein [Candidatus Thiosymbion ectosymbiont of Robbea hypermnestra]|nr:DUF4276 family protein [Candidatus Thiosymbion ectosymbiont of Robbea hypermnestra]
MHFELLVEDQSGKKALDILVPRIIGDGHTFKVHAYRGIGRIPENMRDTDDASKRILLDNLPKLLKGYGKTFAAYPKGYRVAVILVCDLDDRCLKTFRNELFGVLNACDPRPETRFCIAVEEGEAWLLGDLDAVRNTYPKAKDSVLTAYEQDSICGTWERLADAVYPGGTAILSGKGWQAIGAEKSRWAEMIAPKMDVAGNRSPSFRYFCGKLRELAQPP